MTNTHHSDVDSDTTGSIHEVAETVHRGQVTDIALDPQWEYNYALLEEDV